MIFLNEEQTAKFSECKVGGGKVAGRARWDGQFWGGARQETRPNPHISADGPICKRGCNRGSHHLQQRQQSSHLFEWQFTIEKRLVFKLIYMATVIALTTLGYIGQAVFFKGISETAGSIYDTIHDICFTNCPELICFLDVPENVAIVLINVLDSFSTKS